MYYKKVTAVLERKDNLGWLSDNEPYIFFGAENEHGSKADIYKNPGPIFTIKLWPWFGPEIIIDEIDCSKLNFSQDNKVNILIEWVPPCYKVFINDIEVAKKEDEELAKAEEFGLPYDIYTQLDAKDLYRIKLPPGEYQYIIPEDFRIYFIDKYNLSPDNTSLKDFLFDSTNSTQKDRELFHATEYVRHHAKFFEEEPDKSRKVAIIDPMEDYGIDCYIRTILKEPPDHVFTLESVQITEVRLDIEKIMSESESSIEETLAETIVEIVTKSKQKQLPDDNDILICGILQEGSYKTEALPLIFKLRDLFEQQGKWPYGKIVFVNASIGVFTVYVKEPHFHYFIHPHKNIWFYGRTEEDIKFYGESDEDPSFPIRVWPGFE